MALYVHIPFCRSRCLFCGCHSYGLRKPARVEAYLDAVIAEARLATEIIVPTRPVRQVALGGGTPNALTVEQTHRLLSGLEGLWSIEPGTERSVELEPRSATADKLDVFVAHGFNRFSLGIQDFDETVLANVRPDLRSAWSDPHHGHRDVAARAGPAPGPYRPVQLRSRAVDAEAPAGPRVPGLADA
jgi:coproporphyrinogen III oxidase-like Fe-S oxidoreductase